MLHLYYALVSIARRKPWERMTVGNKQITHRRMWTSPRWSERISNSASMGEREREREREREGERKREREKEI